MDRIIKYGMAIVRDGKFLINRKYNTKLFLMPGGKPEAGESVEDCLVREMQEEHKVEVIVDSVKYFGEFEDKASNEPDTIISMKVYTGKVRGEPVPSMEIEEQRWFGKYDNPDILSPIIRNKILPALIGKGIL